MGKMSSERRKSLFPLALGIWGDFVRRGQWARPHRTGWGLCVHLSLCTNVKRSLDHKREYCTLTPTLSQARYLSLGSQTQPDRQKRNGCSELVTDAFRKNSDLYVCDDLKYIYIFIGIGFQSQLFKRLR